MAALRLKNYRWLIAIILFFATTINYIDRQIIGLLKPILEKQFSWSETDFAHIIMAFTAAYAIGLLSFGWLIDKVGTKWGYSISLIIWSIAGMLHALARSVLHFVIARIGLGIGEAGNFPAGMKAISEWFPKKERAIATGIFNAGTSVGVVAALFMVPWILSRYGWQEVFWITGASGFIWLILWLWLYDIPAKQKRLTANELGFIQQGQHKETTYSTGKKISWQKLFTLRHTWAFITGKLLIDPIYWFFLFWLPSYFSSIFKLDLTKPSPELMIIYASTTVGSIGGGYVSSWLIRRNFSAVGARKTALFIFAILEISIILVQFVSDPWLAVGLISVAVSVHQAWATNIFTLSSDLFPTKYVSSVVGIGGMAGAVGGILFPLLIGYLLDHYKNVNNLGAGYNLLFTICGFTYLFAWVIIHLLTLDKN